MPENSDNAQQDQHDLVRELSAIRSVLNERADQAEGQRQAFDALYDEMRQYKDDFIFQAEKPLLLDLLLFYDSLNWFRDSLDRDEMSPEVLKDSFQYLMDEFLEVLYRRDVNPMEARERFDREVHKAIKMEPTANPEEDYRIKQVVKRGFTRGDRVLRAEEVVVARATNAQAPTDAE